MLALCVHKIIYRIQYFLFYNFKKNGILHKHGQEKYPREATLIIQLKRY